jgi:glutamate racemase
VRDAPLGVFDSGLGGLTVVRALRALLPGESIVYLGDTARVPYGTRSADTILRYARSCAAVLTGRGVKALVIACNTASAVALDMLRAELDLPVIGVIEPGAMAAVEIATRLAREGDSRSGRVGVLGTARTIASGAYVRAVGQLSTRLEVMGQAAPLLVPLVEEGWLDGDVPRLAIERYLRPLILAEVGVIVLGCTHYPLLRETIASVAADLAGRPVAVIDSAEATALVVGELLRERGLSATVTGPSTLQLLVTDFPASFAVVAERFLGAGAPTVEQIDL